MLFSILLRDIKYPNSTVLNSKFAALFTNMHMEDQLIWNTADLPPNCYMEPSSKAEKKIRAAHYPSPV